MTAVLVTQVLDLVFKLPLGNRLMFFTVFVLLFEFGETAQLRIKNAVVLNVFAFCLILDTQAQLDIALLNRI